MAIRGNCEHTVDGAVCEICDVQTVEEISVENSEEKSPTFYREIRHYFMMPEETWQAALNYAKQETKFAPPDIMILAHKHESEGHSLSQDTACMVEHGCKLLKS